MLWTFVPIQYRIKIKIAQCYKYIGYKKWFTKFVPLVIISHRFSNTFVFHMKHINKT